MNSFTVQNSSVSVNGAAVILLIIKPVDRLDRRLQVMMLDTATRLGVLEDELKGGSLILVRGPAPAPVVAILSHHLASRFETVAYFMPVEEVEEQYFVAITKQWSQYKVGDIIILDK